MQASATTQMAASRLARREPPKYAHAAVAVLDKGMTIAYGLRLALTYLGDSKNAK